MKNKIVESEPELSRPLKVEKITANGVEETILAGERERRALSARFDLVEIKSLQAKLVVRPKQAGTNFAVDGSLKAEVVQRCVVTLEPLSSVIEQPIHVHFAAPELMGAGAAERALDEEDMEAITDGVIDLGELVAQHLGLALDPYPRKEGLPPVEAEFGDKPLESSPFAKLAALKDRLKE
jgi:uncharacterized metal-binding protein YceD (DUF177 family)